MYLGRLCEIAPSDVLYAAPAHHYTEALLSSAVEPNPEVTRTPVILAGEPPSPINPPSGCRFRTRCPRAEARCAEEVPELRADRPRPPGGLPLPHRDLSHGPSPPPRLAVAVPLGRLPRPAARLAPAAPGPGRAGDRRPRPGSGPTPTVRWNEFDLVLANGAWDNIHRPDEFLAWVGRGGRRHPPGQLPGRAPLESGQALPGRAASTRACPPSPPPGSPRAPTTSRTCTNCPTSRCPTGEFVVKPTVSGGGFETARYRTGDAQSAARRPGPHAAPPRRGADAS